MNLQSSPRFRSTNQTRKRGLVCRLMTSRTSPTQYGPHRMIIANYEKSLYGYCFETNSTGISPGSLFTTIQKTEYLQPPNSWATTYIWLYENYACFFVDCFGWQCIVCLFLSFTAFKFCESLPTARMIPIFFMSCKILCLGIRYQYTLYSFNNNRCLLLSLLYHFR